MGISTEVKEAILHHYKTPEIYPYSLSKEKIEEVCRECKVNNLTELFMAIKILKIEGKLCCYACDRDGKPIIYCPGSSNQEDNKKAIEKIPENNPSTYFEIVCTNKSLSTPEPTII